MEFPEHMMMIVGMIAAAAACLIGLACIAIGAVLSESEKDAVSGDGLLMTASPTNARRRAA
jgi:hypothetical protein